MKHQVIIILAIVIVFLVLICLAVWLCYKRAEKARKKVLCTCDEEKLADLNKLIKPFGFLYDVRQDIFYSSMNPWQRKMGYGRIYDTMAPSMNMIIDCEPVCFRYDNREWMIELWKGQYGIAAGAEIGVYIKKDNFYQSVEDDELLNMRFSLYHENHMIIHRQDRHWWLTGFKLGQYNRRRDLIMEAEILFPTMEMRDAFLTACRKLGYRRENLTYSSRSVWICFDRPKSKQPGRCLWLYKKYIQGVNRRNCKRFCKYTKCFDRTIDKIAYIRYAFPHLYHIIVKITWRKRCKKCGCVQGMKRR
ncbi:MAG: DUF4474 domain-containing protein [Lachnospiraceae bacterium]|nr:DUF4474 domain-containing protein [Lachnospiraceae bacterium]